MKKLLVLICLICVSGCTNSLDTEEVLEKIQTRYNELESVFYKIDVTTSIKNKSQNFVLDFSYNANDDDIIKIIEPLEISEITAKVTGEDLLIEFDGMQIETFLAENKGINPVDVTSYALFDIKNKEPLSIEIDEIIKLRYNEEEICKDIYLNIETYDIIKVEVFVDNSMVILCNYS